MMCALLKVALHLQLLGGEDTEDISKWLMMSTEGSVSLAGFSPTTSLPDIPTVTFRGREGGSTRRLLSD